MLLTSNRSHSGSSPRSSQWSAPTSSLHLCSSHFPRMNYCLHRDLHSITIQHRHSWAFIKGHHRWRSIDGAIMTSIATVIVTFAISSQLTSGSCVAHHWPVPCRPALPDTVTKPTTLAAGMRQVSERSARPAARWWQPDRHTSWLNRRSCFMTYPAHFAARHLCSSLARRSNQLWVLR